jgi:hypothetical protein
MDHDSTSVESNNQDRQPECAQGLQAEAPIAPQGQRFPKPPRLRVQGDLDRRDAPEGTDLCPVHLKPGNKLLPPLPGNRIPDLSGGREAGAPGQEDFCHQGQPQRTPHRDHCLP